MILYRTGICRLGLQLAPRARPSYKHPTTVTVWWDGWIEGPTEEVLASIPDEQMLRKVFEHHHDVVREAV
jgi:hypothetical protein